MNGSPSSLSALRLGRSQPAATTQETSAERRYPLGLNAPGILVALGLLLLIVSVLASGAGALAIPPGDVLAILANNIGLGVGPSPDSRALQYEMVLTGIRLPRVVLGIIAGAGLSVAGALMQGLFRNPLADPALIGVSSGASFGASLMIVLGSLLPGFLASAFGSFSIAIAAFVAGLIVTWIVYRIATHGTQTSVATML
ncbi:MAG: iron chelate uptake ABC transporter family permease subunit, partial [Balneolaceae bacterium]|nr:iron chelate uptake ABC transporter family permease subunit [Balneolaceae bacterium]